MYYWSMDPNDRKRVPNNEWLNFLEGKDAGYPIRQMQNEMSEVRAKAESIRNDMTTPDTRLCDDMNGLNPAQTDVLTQVMLGGLPPQHHGYPLHCRVRYFDPDRSRPGLPENVAALVETFTADEVTVILVNMDQVKGSSVVVQGGAYAEHQITDVEVDGQNTVVNDSAFSVWLAPSCGSRLVIKAKRFVNQPSFDFPIV